MLYAELRLAGMIGGYPVDEWLSMVIKPKDRRCLEVIVAKSKLGEVIS